MFHLDVQVAMAGGLPPLIDRGSWNVRPLSELDDQFIGTSPGLEYEEKVRNGTQEPDPGLMVSSHGIFYASQDRDSLPAQTTCHPPPCPECLYRIHQPCLIKAIERGTSDYISLITIRTLDQR